MSRALSPRSDHAPAGDGTPSPLVPPPPAISTLLAETVHDLRFAPRAALHFGLVPALGALAGLVVSLAAAGLLAMWLLGVVGRTEDARLLPAGLVASIGPLIALAAALTGLTWPWFIARLRWQWLVRLRPPDGAPLRLALTAPAYLAGLALLSTALLLPGLCWLAALQLAIPAVAVHGLAPGAAAAQSWRHFRAWPAWRLRLALTSVSIVALGLVVPVVGPPLAVTATTLLSLQAYLCTFGDGPQPAATAGSTGSSAAASTSDM